MRKEWLYLNIKVRKIDQCSQEQMQENSGKDQKKGIKKLLGKTKN
jgi:hypothetical protein